MATTYEDMRQKCLELGCTEDDFDVLTLGSYFPPQDRASYLLENLEAVYNKAVENCQRKLEETTLGFPGDGLVMKGLSDDLESLKKLR